MVRSLPPATAKRTKLFGSTFLKSGAWLHLFTFYCKDVIYMLFDFLIVLFAILILIQFFDNIHTNNIIEGYEKTVIVKTDTEPTTMTTDQSGIESNNASDIDTLKQTIADQQKQIDALKTQNDQLQNQLNGISQQQITAANDAPAATTSTFTDTSSTSSSLPTASSLGF